MKENSERGSFILLTLIALSAISGSIMYFIWDSDKTHKLIFTGTTKVSNNDHIKRAKLVLSEFETCHTKLQVPGGGPLGPIDLFAPSTINLSIHDGGQEIIGHEAQRGNLFYEEVSLHVERPYGNVLEGTRYFLASIRISALRNKDKKNNFLGSPRIFERIPILIQVDNSSGSLLRCSLNQSWMAINPDDPCRRPESCSFAAAISSSKTAIECLRRGGVPIKKDMAGMSLIRDIASDSVGAYDEFTCRFNASCPSEWVSDGASSFEGGAVGCK